MASNIEKANEDVSPLLETLEKKGLHGDKKSEGVTIDFLLAFAERDDDGNKKDVALKVRGIPALGCARVVNYKDRVKGNADCEITFDGDWWHDHSRTENERLALLDHELTHLIPTGETDKAGRPKIRLRKHDFEVGWFHDVAKRWGADSAEVQQAQALRTPELEQTYFAFDSDEFDGGKVVGINA